MKRLPLVTVLLVLGLLLGPMVANAATGKIIKVLPHLLDSEGRHSVSPSLYDRDAYQKFLRDHPKSCTGLRFDINWKTKGPAFEPLTLRLEVRGTAEGNLPKQLVLETAVTPGGRWFGRWSALALLEGEYKHIGKVTAWRATLWEGGRLLSERKSFLW